MQEQENNKELEKLGGEPGRRYTAGRIRPRAGSDIRPVTHASRQQPSSTPGPVNPVTHPKQFSATSVAQMPQKSRTPGSVKPALPRTARSIVLKRQIVERAQHERKKVRKKRQRHLVLYAIALAVIIAGLLILWSFQELLPARLRFFNNDTSQASQAEKPKAPETSSLDETAVSKESIISYMMADDAPRVLRIPKLDVEARVLRVGASLKGEPIAPTNIFDVGWFESSGKPGVPGAVLLNGHTKGPTKNGVFNSLRQLVPGDEIQVERGDGTILKYKVSKIQEYSPTQVDMSAAVEPIDPTKQGLNLMTTANSYDRQSDQAQKRIIVFAIL